MKTLFFWLVVIFVLSVYPLERSSSILFSQEDKVVHFLIYAITTPLVYVVLRQSGAAFLKRVSPLLIAVVFTVIYGLSMELAQHIMTTTRRFSAADAVANALGATAGLIYVFIIRMRGARKS